MYGVSFVGLEGDVISLLCGERCHWKDTLASTHVHVLSSEDGGYIHGCVVYRLASLHG